MPSPSGSAANVCNIAPCSLLFALLLQLLDRRLALDPLLLERLDLAFEPFAMRRKRHVRRISCAWRKLRGNADPLWNSS